MKKASGSDVSYPFYELLKNDPGCIYVDVHVCGGQWSASFSLCLFLVFFETGFLNKPRLLPFCQNWPACEPQIFLSRPPGAGMPMLAVR